MRGTVSVADSGARNHLAPEEECPSASYNVAVDGKATGRESAELVEASAEAMGDGLVVHSKGVVLFANAAAGDTLGFGSADELREASFEELLALTEAFSALGGPKTTYHFLRRDGRPGFVDAVSIRGRYRGQEAWHTWLRDVSERETLKLALERSNRLEALGRLCGSIAHDFNNLLTGIRGSLEVVRYKADDDRGREAAVEAAEQAAMRAASLTRELLNYSRGTRSRETETDPNALVREAVELFAQTNKAAPLTLTLCPHTGQARISPSHFYQVVMNLLSNAQHAVRGGGAIGIATELVHKVRAGDVEARPYIQLVVSDTGTGIDPDTRRHIFEPFFSTKPPNEGTGLGLSTVYGIIRQAGGWVEVDSRPGSGTTFTVYLPRSADHATSMGNAGDSAQEHVTGRTVLVCDDETRLATLTAGLLEEFGFTTHIVGTGEEALERLSGEEPVDMLLLDVNLAEGLTVREVLQEMQNRALGCPALLTSGLAVEDVPKALLEHPSVAGYLAKPYTVEELVASINRTLGKAAAD